MNLSESLKARYTAERLSALEAQRLAQFIAFGPIAFQVARTMLKSGILEFLNDSRDGATVERIAEAVGLSVYATKCLFEASLGIGLILVDAENDTFRLSKAGWFLLTDPSVRVNMDFNHDVNYRGMFRLDESLRQGVPAGLGTLSDRATIYEALSELGENESRSWFAFDHFYSDNSFDRALEIVLRNRPRTLLDVGGNTGRWARRCLEADSDITVTVLDLPGQIRMLEKSVAGTEYCGRLKTVSADILACPPSLLSGMTFDAVWMSQFLDCFSEPQVTRILRIVAQAMNRDSRLYVMETFWDRQRFETSAMCLTMTSLYFTAMANGNSKMYHSDDLTGLIEEAGFEVAAVHDGLGWGHTILECVKKE